MNNLNEVNLEYNKLYNSARISMSIIKSRTRPQKQIDMLQFYTDKAMRSLQKEREIGYVR